MFNNNLLVLPDAEVSDCHAGGERECEAVTVGSVECHRRQMGQQPGDLIRRKQIGVGTAAAVVAEQTDAAFANLPSEGHHKSATGG